MTRATARSLVEQKLVSEAYGQARSKIVFGVLSYKLSPVILELLELTSHLSLQVKCCVDFDYRIGFAYLLFLSLISLQDFDIHHYCFTSL
mgnify:FL=1